MTEVVMVRFDLKKGRRDIWLKWCEEAKRRRSEVLETMRSEGVVSEACFLSEDQEQVYYFMEAENLEKASTVFRQSSFPIDKEHKRISEATLEKPVRLKELFHFQQRPFEGLRRLSNRKRVASKMDASRKRTAGMPFDSAKEIRKMRDDR